MTRRLLFTYAPLALGLALVASAVPARAATYFDATLLSSNQVVPNGSPATGFGTVVLNDPMDTITVDESWTGLLAPATASHIHTGAAGTNGPVTFPFAGVPFATSGSIPTQSFAINAVQLANLQAGNMYMNIHDAVYPGGEIRGQLLARTSSVPEPGSLAMLLGAAPAALCALRRRKIA